MQPEPAPAMAQAGTRKLRILHLLNHCGRANGHVNVSVDLACIQARAGQVVGYACAEGDFFPLLERYGVAIYRVPQPHRSLRGFAAANLALNRAIRDFRPDILHVHMAAQSVLVQPYRLRGYRVVTTLHNEFDRSAWLMGLADRVVTVGPTGYAQMRRRGVPERRLRLVQNGTIGSPRLEGNIQPAELAHPSLLTVCGMHPRKGVADLLQAFARIAGEFPAARLYLAGEGPMLEEYRQLAAELGLAERAIFLGFCADPRGYLAAADIFILASHADPGPLVIGEARHAGCAIIASEVDGIPAMLGGGEAGLLVPPRDPARLAEAMARLLRDPELLAAYRARAAAGSEYYAVERVCREMDAVYRELL